MVLSKSYAEDACVSGRQHFRGFCGKGFKQIVDARIPVGTKCAPLLTDIFLYSYEADFILYSICYQREGNSGISVQFYIQIHQSDILSINNPEFVNLNLGQMLNFRSKTRQSATHLLLIFIYSCQSGGMVNYDKHDDFNIHITNFSFLSSNISSSPAYGVFISRSK